MAFAVELKLKLINIVCQAYVFSFSFLTLVLFINVTLPKVTEGDHSTLRRLTFLMYYIFFNVWGNYICVWYKSRFSVVKSECSKSILDPLCLPPSIILSPKNVTAASRSPITIPANNDNNSYQSWNGYCHIKEKWMKTSTFTNKEHTNCLTFADSIFENQQLNDNMTSNNKYKLFSGFTYSNNFEKKSNEFNREIGMKNTVRDSALTSEAVKEPTLVIAGWTRCRDCNMTVPPRSKHCPLCGHCVLKRDHHCFFMGCCVGFHNQRFFIIFCLYSAIGVICSCVVTLIYLRGSYEASHTWGYLAYLFPVVLYIWLMGATSGFTVGMVIYLYWTIMTALVCCYYFIVQIFLIYHGQTKYECLKRIKTYQGTVWKNFTSVFGRYWPVGFIIPAPFFGYHHDGVDWTELWLTVWKYDEEAEQLGDRTEK